MGSAEVAPIWSEKTGVIPEHKMLEKGAKEMPGKYTAAASLLAE